MIIEYKAWGTIQAEGEDPSEVIRELTPLSLVNLGQINRVSFFIDGKPSGFSWDFPNLKFAGDKEKVELPF